MTANRSSRAGILRAVAALAALAVTFALVAAPQGQAANLTTAELVEKAKARQESVKSFDVKLKQTEVVSPGAVSGMAAGMPGLSPKSMIPSKQTTLTSENRLVVRGSNFRYEDNHPAWLIPAGTLHQRSRVLVSNGAVAKSYFPKGMNGDRDDGVGLIHEQKWHNWGTAAVFMPVMMAFRGLDATLAAYDVRRLKPGNVSLPVAGVPCGRFELGSSNRQTFWMDDFGLLRRVQHERNGKLSLQCDVRYERRYGVDHFPISWVLVQYSPSGSVTNETTVEVLDATVNQNTSSTEFEVRFPPGCKVHDMKVSKEYLVQPDGSMRESNPPSGKSPETRTQDEPGFLSRYRAWIGVCLGVILLLLLGGYVLRRKWRKQ